MYQRFGTNIENLSSIFVAVRHPIEDCEACPRLNSAADSTMDHEYNHRVRPMSRILLNC